MSQKTGSAVSDNDFLALIFIGVVGAAVFGTAILGFAAGLFSTAAAWAIEHGLMVAAADAVLPIGSGGLDAPRIFVAASAVVILILAASQLRRRHKKD